MLSTLHLYCGQEFIKSNFYASLHVWWSRGRPVLCPERSCGLVLSHILEGFHSFQETCKMCCRACQRHQIVLATSTVIEDRSASWRTRAKCSNFMPEGPAPASWKVLLTI